MTPDRSTPAEHESPTPAPTAAAAQAYAARGWSVLPIEARGKRPLIAWRALQQRRAEPREIETWYRRWPDANVGIVTGRVSGLVVIDVDPGHGGSASLAALDQAHGPLPPTVEAATGGGGRHLYYAHPGRSTPNRVSLFPGIDVRGDGGCVVAPPSVHPSGRRYAWVRGPEAFAPAPVPVRFLAPMGLGHLVAHPPGHWRDLVRDGADEGRRNDTIASLTGHLLRHDVDLEVILGLMQSWNRTRCRPPLPDDEVEAVVRSIARVHRRAASRGS